MPTLLKAERLIIEFKDLNARRPLERPEEPPARDPGAHQSEILAYVARNIGKLKAGEKLEEDIPERMLMGYMWEEFYFSMLTNVIWQPGEAVEDGIAVNCDGIGAGGGEDVCWAEEWVEETKCTSKKVKTGEEFLEEWMWMHQGRAYGYVYGPKVVRWAILYFMGDYRGSGPVIMRYTVQFSDKEVEQTWRMLTKNKDAAMAELAEIRELEAKEAEKRGKGRGERGV